MILSRYLLREHLSPFVFGLSLIVFIFMLNLVFQMLGRIAGKGIPVPVIIEYFALNIAWIMALAVPMGVLIASLAAFGRMAGDGEITALRASGVSVSRLIAPALAASFMVTLWVAWFNNYVLPDMNHRTKLLMTDISRKKPTLNIEPNIYNFTIPNYVMHVSEVNPETNGLRDVTIYDEHIPERRSSVSADSGRLDFIETEEIILLTLYSGEIHRLSDRDPDSYEWTSFDSALFRMPAPGMLLRRASSGYRGDRELSAMAMWEKVQELKGKEGEQNLRRINSYMVEIHKKFSIPAACMVFVLVGAPLGMLAHRGGMGVAGGISLIFFTIYWAFLAAGEKLADRGHLSPAASMWAPNLFILAVGLWLLWVARHRTSLPAAEWVSALAARLFKGKDAGS